MTTRSESRLDDVPATHSAERATVGLDSAVSAALLAAGIGSLALGVFTVLNETSPAINSFLRWVPPVGPLSGKVGMAVLAFVISWVVLHYAFRTRPVKLATSYRWSLLLVALGLLLTFPPVFVFLNSIL